MSIQKLDKDQEKNLINAIAKKINKKNEKIFFDEIYKVYPQGDMDLSEYINVVLTCYNAIILNFLAYIKDYSANREKYILNTNGMIDAFAFNLKDGLRQLSEVKDIRTIN